MTLSSSPSSSTEKGKKSKTAFLCSFVLGRTGSHVVQSGSIANIESEFHILGLHLPVTGIIGTTPDIFPLRFLFFYAYAYTHMHAGARRVSAPLELELQTVPVP